MLGISYARGDTGERRQTVDGSIVFDGNTSRLRVVRASRSLGVAIDVLDAAGSYVPLTSTPLGADLEIIEADGRSSTALFVSFEALYGQETISGVALLGSLADYPIKLFIRPEPAGSGYQVRIAWENPHALRCRRLTHAWRLEPDHLPVQVQWPRNAAVPLRAALLQTDAFFCGLAADPEEDACPAVGGRLQLDDTPRFEYGIMPADGAPVTAPARACFAYTLCVDGRAQTGRGFQLLTRLLGRSAALACAAQDTSLSVLDDLPPLPLPAARDWRPCCREGAPAEIAALARHYLALAEDGDLHHLDDGLCWLDRLGLEQQVHEIPGGVPVGRLGEGAEWVEVNRWAPALFFAAYRLSGRAEYLARGLAASSALLPS